MDPTVQQHFTNCAPEVRAIYDSILKESRKFGPVKEDPKKTSIHLMRKNAFAGIATRKTAMILTLKSTEDINDPRIAKHQQASARRWYLEIKLSSPGDVNKRLLDWLKNSYEISG